MIQKSNPLTQTTHGQNPTVQPPTAQPHQPVHQSGQAQSTTTVQQTGPTPTLQQRQMNYQQQAPHHQAPPNMAPIVSPQQMMQMTQQLHQQVDMHPPYVPQQHYGHMQPYAPVVFIVPNHGMVQNYGMMPPQMPYMAPPMGYPGMGQPVPMFFGAPPPYPMGGPMQPYQAYPSHHSVQHYPPPQQMGHTQPQQHVQMPPPKSTTLPQQSMGPPQQHASAKPVLSQTQSPSNPTGLQNPKPSQPQDGLPNISQLSLKDEEPLVVKVNLNQQVATPTPPTGVQGAQSSQPLPPVQDVKQPELPEIQVVKASSWISKAKVTEINEAMLVLQGLAGSNVKGAQELLDKLNKDINQLNKASKRGQAEGAINNLKGHIREVQVAGGLQKRGETILEMGKTFSDNLGVITDIDIVTRDKSNKVIFYQVKAGNQACEDPGYNLKTYQKFENQLVNSINLLPHYSGKADEVRYIVDYTSPAVEKLFADHKIAYQYTPAVVIDPQTAFKL